MVNRKVNWCCVSVHVSKLSECTIDISAGIANSLPAVYPRDPCAQMCLQIYSLQIVHNSRRQSPGQISTGGQFDIAFWWEENYSFFFFPLNLKKCVGVLGMLSCEESISQWRRHRRCGFDPWVGDPLEEEMAVCSSIPAWRIPRTEDLTITVPGVTKRRQDLVAEQAGTGRSVLWDGASK